MLADRRRWLVVVAVVMLAVAVIAVVRRGGQSEDGPEAVHAEAIVCADVYAVPAEASSGDLQRANSEVVQDPRCDELAALPAPGGVVLPRHSEGDAAVGNVVLAGELRFDAQSRCFYVVTGDEPIGVVWPARFTGKADPPRVTDEDGSTVVSAGDSFKVRGRYLSGVSEHCGPVALESTGFVANGEVVLTNG